MTQAGFYATQINGDVVRLVDKRSEALAGFMGSNLAHALDAINPGATDRISASVVGDFFSFSGGLWEEPIPNTNGLGKPYSLFDSANVIVNEIVERATKIDFRPEPCDTGVTVTGIQPCPPDNQPWATPTVYGRTFDLKPLGVNVSAAPCDLLTIPANELESLFSREFQRLTRLTSATVSRILTSGSVSGLTLGTDSPQFLAEGTATVLNGGIPASAADALARISSALSVSRPGLTGTIYVPSKVWALLVSGASGAIVETAPGRFITKDGGHMLAIDPGLTGRAPGALTDPAIDDPTWWLYATTGRPNVLLSPITSPNLQDSTNTVDFHGVRFPANAFGVDTSGRFNNTMRIFARRKFVVAFDPCVILAMPVSTTIPLYGASTGGGGGGAAGFASVNGYDIATGSASIPAGVYSVTSTATTRSLVATIVGPDTIDHWEVYTSRGRKNRYAAAASSFTLDWTGVSAGQYEVITRAVMRSGKAIETTDIVVVTPGAVSWTSPGAVTVESYPVTVGAVARIFDGASGVFTSTIPAITGQFQLDRVMYDESDDPFVGGGESPALTSPGAGFVEATLNGLPGWAVLKPSAVAPYTVASFDFYSSTLVLSTAAFDTKRLGREYNERVLTYRLDGATIATALPHEPSPTGIGALTNITVGNVVTIQGTAADRLVSWAYRWTYDTGNAVGDDLIINGDPNLDNVPRIGTAGYGEPGWQHTSSGGTDADLTGVNHFQVNGNARIEIKATFRSLVP